MEQPVKKPAFRNLSEFKRWKELMEERIEQGKLTPLEIGNLRMFVILERALYKSSKK